MNKCKMLVLFGLTVCIGGNVYSDIPTAERNILIKFYNSTNGTNWTNNTGWADAIPGTECTPVPGLD